MTISVLHHLRDGLFIGKVSDDTGHIQISGKLACLLAAGGLSDFSGAFAAFSFSATILSIIAPEISMTFPGRRLSGNVISSYFVFSLVYGVYSHFPFNSGPTGPANGLNAYGGRFSNTGQTISISVGTQTQISLPATMPVLNENYNTPNSITIFQTGNYEISYFLSATAAVATTLTLAVRQNGVNIPSLEISRLLAVGTSSIYSGSAIVTLPAGSIIDMALSALLAVGVTLGSSVNASLIVKRID